MSVNLQLTGLRSFCSPLTYQTGVMQNQVVKVRDEDAPKLLALQSKDPSTGVLSATFTSVSSPPVVHYDLTKKAEMNRPVALEYLSYMALLGRLKVDAEYHTKIGTFIAKTPNIAVPKSGRCVLSQGSNSSANSLSIVNAGPLTITKASIPGYLMSPQSHLLVRARWLTDPAAHNRTMRYKFGDQVVAEDILVAVSNIRVTTHEIVIANQNSYVVQSTNASGNEFTPANIAPKSTTVDTRIDSIVEIIGDVSNQRMTLDSFSIELISTF